MSDIRLQGLSGEEETTAAARSALYGWLAAAFAFPSPGLSEAFASGLFRREIQTVGAALPFVVPIGEEWTAGASLSPEAIEEQYIRLFEVGPGNPPCPLYEGSHRRGRQEILEDLVRFYEHFGLRHQEEDLPDHLCCELEFMHYLAFKEAAALHAGGGSRGYQLAQRDFLQRHLDRWLPHLRDRLEQLQPPPLYPSLARLTEGACRLDFLWLKEAARAGPGGEAAS